MNKIFYFKITLLCQGEDDSGPREVEINQLVTISLEEIILSAKPTYLFILRRHFVLCETCYFILRLSL